jgi:5-methylcytosine-specific restriction endonuclease McrA
MAHLNWRRYHRQFNTLAGEISDGKISDPADIGEHLRSVCSTDPAADQVRMGVESYRLAFLEFLFARAEGPYSPGFSSYAEIIRTFMGTSEPLRNLIGHNAADAIGNMILNRRGRLKFLIADHLELLALLEWWPRFGLEPVSERQVLDAILKKSVLRHRLATGDPGLLLRLLEVFPENKAEYCPESVSREDLLHRLSVSVPPPSFRRYHRLYTTSVREGRDLVDMIKQEEKRILPVHIRRNTFLAFLVKKLHQDTCQVCRLCGKGGSENGITVHHIIPLSEGGADQAWNMLVVCGYHHQAIHEGEIRVCVSDQIHIRCKGGAFVISPVFTGPVT